MEDILKKLTTYITNYEKTIITRLEVLVEKLIK